MTGSRFKGKKALITGGLGFIGSNLARRLAGYGARVTLVDNLAPEYGGSRRNILGLERQVKVEIRDVRDGRAMRRLARGQDYLFNLAGQSSHLDSMRDPFTDLEMNCRAPLTVLEACRSANPRVKVVFASTRQVYGSPERLPVGEDHPLRPVDVNGVNKLAGEQFHLVYARAWGLDACVLRLTNTYGPGMRVKDDKQTFLGTWIRLILQGRPFEVWGGRQKRDFTFVDDAVDALLLAAGSGKTPGRVFNVGGAGPVSLKRLAELLVRVNGGGRFSVRPYPRERKRIEIGDYCSDFRLIRRVLGHRPEIPLAEGLKRTLAYYRGALPDHL